MKVSDGQPRSTAEQYERRAERRPPAAAQPGPGRTPPVDELLAELVATIRTATATQRGGSPLIEDAGVGAVEQPSVMKALHPGARRSRRGRRPCAWPRCRRCSRPAFSRAEFRRYAADYRAALRAAATDDDADAARPGAGRAGAGTATPTPSSCSSTACATRRRRWCRRCRRCRCSATTCTPSTTRCCATSSRRRKQPAVRRVGAAAARRRQRRHATLFARIATDKAEDNGGPLDQRRRAAVAGARRSSTAWPAPSCSTTTTTTTVRATFVNAITHGDDTPPDEVVAQGPSSTPPRRARRAHCAGRPSLRRAPRGVPRHLPDGVEALVAEVRADPARRDELLALLREDAAVHQGRGASTATRIRGWVLAAFADVGLPDGAVPYVLEDLENDIDPLRRRRGGPRHPRPDGTDAGHRHGAHRCPRADARPRRRA